MDVRFAHFTEPARRQLHATTASFRASMDFLTIIAAAAAIIWAALFVFRGSLVGGCLAAIIVGSCFGYAFWHAEGGLPITADRAIIGALVGMYVVRRRW